MSSRGTSLDFVFSNLISGFYNRATICFHPKGDRLLIPQGNRVVIFDILRGETKTHYVEHPTAITRIAISEKDDFVATADKSNNLFITQLGSSKLIYKKVFKSEITALAFGPDNFGLAVASNNKVKFFKYFNDVNTLKPFIKKRPPIGGGHFAEVTSITFSPDGKLIATTSVDLSINILLTEPTKEFEPVTLTGHRGKPLFCYFDKNQRRLTTLGGDATLFVWELDEECNVKLLSRRRLDEEDYDNPKMRHQNILMAACNGDQIVCGYSDGVFRTFALVDTTTPVMSTFTVKFSAEKMKSICISEKFAAFTSKIGELIVWDLQQGAVAQRSQGHLGGVSCFAYSPNGIIMATGDDHGKVKLWDSQNGSCILTFSEHKDRVSDISFGESGRTVATCSYDGTIKVYDVIRGQKFREFSFKGEDGTIAPTQFTHVALNKQCTMVAAVSATNHCAYVWMLQKDDSEPIATISGHSGPITALQFTPMSRVLTGSQDSTVRITDILSDDASSVINVPEMVTAAVISPDEKDVVVACGNGKLYFYQLEGTDYVEVADLNVKNDARGGRRIDEMRSAQSTSWYFETMDFSPDGAFIVCGGKTKFICVYSVKNHLLMRRFAHTKNNDYSGVEGYIKKPKSAAKGDDTAGLKFGISAKVIEAEARSVRWCPTGRGIAAATQEGLLVYVTADQVITDPIELETDVTPEEVSKAVSEGEYVRAVTLGVRLGHTENKILFSAIQSVPTGQIDFVSSNLPNKYVPDFLQFLSESLRDSQDVELLIKWTKAVLRYHASRLSQQSSSVAASHLIRKSFASRIEPVKKIARENLDTLTFLCSQPEPQ